MYHHSLHEVDLILLFIVVVVVVVVVVVETFSHSVLCKTLTS